MSVSGAPRPRLGSFDGVDEFEGLGVPEESAGPEPSGAPVPPRPTRRARWTDDLPAPDALLEGLNGPQRRAVVHRGTPLLVVAGAGSGKTRVLTHRVAHLIATGDATPWEILAITFTNKAADEMRERLVGLIGPVAQRMWVSTFHAACVRILRAHADRLGYRKSFTIYDDSDSRRLVEHVLRDLNIDAKKLPARSVQASISGAKAELASASSYAQEARSVFERRIADVYQEYEQRLFAASAMDFDDLLLLTVRLFEAAPDVLDSYRTRFKHVLVDEFQDTNRAQNEIVLMLAAEHHNVCVVETATSPSSDGAAPTSATSWNSKRRSPTLLSSRSSRTTGRPRRSSTPPTPSSPTTPPVCPRSCGPRGRPAAPSSATGPRTSTTRRPGWPPRSGACTNSKASTTERSPSSTAPTRRAGRSRKSSCEAPSPTRWWAAPGSTTGGR